MWKGFIGAAGALVLAVAAPQASAQGTGAPRIAVAEPTKDFGTVPKGEKITHVFQVRNNGAGDLQILAAKPTCGCLVAEFDKVIKPGAVGRVTAIVDTAIFAGPISKSVMLETNDAAAPTAQLTVNAVVKPYVDAHPAGYLRFNLLEGETATQSVTLYSEEAEPFRILSVEDPQPWIEVRHRKLSASEAVAGAGRAGQAQYRLDVTVKDGARIGPLAEKIRIVTNSKHQGEYLLAVSGTVRPPFRVEPTAVNFGEVAPSDSAATRTIGLRSNNLKAPGGFVVSNVQSNVPGVSATVAPTDRQGEFQVTLQVVRNAAPGPLQGEITVHTNHAKRPLVTIPIKGVVRAER